MGTPKREGFLRDAVSHGALQHGDHCDRDGAKRASPLCSLQPPVQQPRQQGGGVCAANSTRTSPVSCGGHTGHRFSLPLLFWVHLELSVIAWPRLTVPPRAEAPQGIICPVCPGCTHNFCIPTKGAPVTVNRPRADGQHAASVLRHEDQPEA